MGYENKILNLFKNGYLTTKDVVSNNIPRIYLTKLVKDDKIERVSRGVYIKKNVLVDEFIIKVLDAPENKRYVDREGRLGAR